MTTIATMEGSEMNEVLKMKYKFENSYFINEAYKTLRTNIQFCGTDVKVIAFTSCEAHEGKTSVCTELARSFAANGQKILLIDTDMRKSVMARRYANVNNAVGLSNYLSGLSTVEEVKYPTESGYDVIFSGPFPPNPAELLGSNAFRKLIEEKSKYDYIFVDTAPLGMVIDGAVVATCCDSAVIVVSIDTVDYRDVNGVKDQIAKSGCRILGVVLNHTSAKSEKKYKKAYGKYAKGYYNPYKHYEDSKEKKETK